MFKATASSQDFSTLAGASCSFGCVATYHNDNARDGVNGNEISLNPSNSGTLTLLKNIDTLDGLVYTQPLYLSGVTMAGNCAGSNKNVVIVATENNTVYAFDVTPGSTTPYSECWHKSLNLSTEYAIPFTDLTGSAPKCTNIVPQEGVTGTPVIDTSVTPPAIYIASAVKTMTSWDFKLSVLTVNNGNHANQSPLYLSSLITGQVGGANFIAINENQRAGLSLYHPLTGNKAKVYVSFASHCDSTPYQGYVVGFQYNYGNPASWTNLGVFNSQNISGGNKGGIWMSGAAPAIDPNGSIYLSVGNGTWNGQPNSSNVPTALGESTIQLVQSGSNLTAVDYYTPNDFNFLNNGSGTNSVCLIQNSGGVCPSQSTVQLTKNDYDLGAAGVILISPVGSGYASLCGASNGELVAGGKEGVLYRICYNANSTTGGVMGGLDSCGYNFSSICSGAVSLNAVAAITACTQANQPTPGSIAQCFDAIPTLAGQETGNRGTPAFWTGTTALPQNYLYVSGVADAMRGYQFASSGSFYTTSINETMPHSYPYPGATPSVSWLGSGLTPDNSTGLVWAVDSGPFGNYNYSTDKTTSSGAATLFGYTAIPNQNTLTNVFRSDKITLPVGVVHYGPGAVKFTVPTIAAGLVFVAGGAANPNYYSPGFLTTSGANCTPSFGGGSCFGALYIYGLPYH